MTENPMVIGAECIVKCHYCGKPIDDETDFYDMFGFPLCYKCGFEEGYDD